MSKCSCLSVSDGIIVKSWWFNFPKVTEDKGKDVVISDQVPRSLQALIHHHWFSAFFPYWYIQQEKDLIDMKLHLCMCVVLVGGGERLRGAEVYV